jgi:DNA polymerase elongation subunit (family B)
MTPNGQFFRKDIHGFLPVMMKTLYEERAIFKKKMITEKKRLQTLTDKTQKEECERLISRYNNLQLARKIQLNSAYGALGNAWFRFFDTRLAEGITTAGQLSIKWIEKKINEKLNKVMSSNDDFVIAVDTDSVYLKLKPLITWLQPKKDINTIEFMDNVCGQVLMPHIDKSYQELCNYVNGYEQSMAMKREILADKAIWTAKKRYIVNVWNDEGVALKEPKMKIMGLEMIKSSTPEVCRSKMKEAVKLIMNGTEDDVISFIEKFRQEFYKLPAEEVAFPRGVNGLRTYTDADTTYKKGTPIHVKGSLIYNALLAERGLLKMYPKVQDSDKIKFMYLTLPNPFKTNTIAFPLRLPPTLGIEEYIDYPLQFEKAFLAPLKIVLNPIGWKTEKENTIERFFVTSPKK